MDFLVYEHNAQLEDEGLQKNGKHNQKVEQAESKPERRKMLEILILSRLDCVELRIDEEDQGDQSFAGHEKRQRHRDQDQVEAVIEHVLQVESHRSTGVLFFWRDIG